MKQYEIHYIDENGLQQSTFVLADGVQQAIRNLLMEESPTNIESVEPV